MSQLRSVLDQMAAVAGEDLTIDELETEITEIIHACDVLDVLLAKHLKSLADRRGHEELGYQSPTAFLKHQGPHVGGSRPPGGSPSQRS
jgi:hypothetical protein